MGKRHPVDLKIELVREFLKGEKTVSEIAKENNVAENTLRGWIDKYSADSSCVDENFNLEQSKKIKEQQARILELEKENRFLIQTSAFFAKSNLEGKKK